MKRTFILLAALWGCLFVSAAVPQFNYRKLNAKASKEYLKAVHPGGVDGHAYWNVYAKKFTYAPSFDFKEVDGASRYLYEISSALGEWSFVADTPNESLAKVWNSIPVGDVVLKVSALDAKGAVKELVGERKFFRDFPFQGPYNPAVRGYRQAAVMGMLYVHNMKAVKSWLKNSEPDMSYDHNTYANKIIGGTVRMEVLLARTCPQYADEAIAIARNAAQFLMSLARKDGEPMAYFPPTYYKNLVASKRSENQGKLMTMDGTFAAQAYLDLYDYTKEQKYFDEAMHMMDTYARIQAEDGSFPIKVDIATAEPVNAAKAMLHPILRLALRVERQYGVKKYEQMRRKAEQWMMQVPMHTFDLTGQFEDVTVMNIRAYQNLTNCTAAPFATYLLSKDNPTPEEVSQSEELVRFSEDQFVYWDNVADQNGLKRDTTPCVFEQYKYAMPVDNSACNVANAMLSLYENNGDELMLAKAVALLDTITVVQDIVTGQIPTTWRLRYKKPTFWINCSYASVVTLLRLDDILSNR